ncbi:MAG TPA: hypothetical protein VGE11_16455 [Pseudonocardia sp.]
MADDTWVDAPFLGEPRPQLAHVLGRIHADLLRARPMMFDGHLLPA